MSELKVIAKIKSDFPTKFGVPRQSGMVSGIYSYVVFEKEFSDPSAVRGLKEFDYIWLIWHFDGALHDFQPTVRPPKLGGNKRVGVFATRSPNRPNQLGLSCVRLADVIYDNGITILKVDGADLVNGTLIYDVKPYVPFTDCKADASAGFTDSTSKVRLYVDFPQFLLEGIAPMDRQAITKLLELDPRPGYHDDPERVYGMRFKNYDVRFKVIGTTLTVVDILIV